MDKIVKTLVATNVLLTIAMVAVIISLISHVKAETGSGQATQTKNQANTAVQAKLDEITKTKTETVPLKSVDVTLSDDKVTPLGFSAYTDDKIELNITNSGKIARNFQIEGLNFDSGSINPGETKKISLGTIPEKQETYEYKSVANGDSPTLKGSLIILVRQ